MYSLCVCEKGAQVRHTVGESAVTCTACVCVRREHKLGILWVKVLLHVQLVCVCV